jgi:hypothetical protein
MPDQAEQDSTAELAPPPVRAKRPPVVLEQVRDDDTLKVWRHRGKNDRLVISFSGVGTLRHGVEPNFVKTSTDLARNHVLYIADPQRTWLNGPGLLEEIVALVESEASVTGARQIVTMGHSMGGFCALALPGFTRIDAVLAYSPQVSVDPSLAPDEKRWELFRSAIQSFVVPSALGRTAPDSEYYILFGDTRRETPQVRLLEPRSNLHLFMLPGVKHHTAETVVKAGLGEDLLNAAFNRRVWRIRRQLRQRFGGYQVPMKEATA